MPAASWPAEVVVTDIKPAPMPPLRAPIAVAANRPAAYSASISSPQLATT